MLARDIKELLGFGYKLERVTPFDMFPQTAHCEAVAELAKSDSMNKLNKKGDAGLRSANSAQNRNAGAGRSTCPRRVEVV
jgi:hypothetical protein